MPKRDIFQKMINDLDIAFLFSGMSESTYKKKRKRIIRQAAESKKKRK